MIKSVGLQNIGASGFTTRKLRALRPFPAPIIANVFGYAPDDYAEVIRILEGVEGLAGY